MLTDLERHRDPTAATYYRDVKAWVAPFFMGVVNTRVVRRSWGLCKQWQQSYGENFSYQEYLKFDSPWAGLQAVAVVGMMAAAGAISIPLPRRLLESLMPQPGSGPTEQTMDEGWFIRFDRQ